MPIIQDNPYESLSYAIEDLKAKGYTYDFNQKEAHLRCNQNEKDYRPEDFTITHTYRFEGMSNPDDNSVLYGIEAADGTKGLLVDAYGVYADSLSEDMIEKFRVEYEDPDEV
ncbi:phosphoribosylpyrophosphate synthetase [Lewinella sp. JB7]|uniref:phosphoribosylpyrophosphate synthetase n=1 Tax=Lewinella sp. JB7 TaxID=2962887 RepID=UPI0020C98FEE|nr:phosphoribosylpyrophosphate synthetase [Lewinella sp. JB7]MCP9236873.1 phosphoribosylpyrophosphate synthetase [Lewinella sp. JB7]